MVALTNSFLHFSLDLLRVINLRFLEQLPPTSVASKSNCLAAAAWILEHDPVGFVLWFESLAIIIKINCCARHC